MREQLEGRRSVQWLIARASLVSESIRVGRHKADRQTGPYSALQKRSDGPFTGNGNVFVYERIGGYLLLFYVYR